MDTHRDVFMGQIKVGQRVGCQPDRDTETPARFGELVEITIEAGYAWARVQFDNLSRMVMVDPEVLWPEDTLKHKLENET